jgi:hypothetical protein
MKNINCKKKEIQNKKCEERKKKNKAKKGKAKGVSQAFLHDVDDCV